MRIWNVLLFSLSLLSVGCSFVFVSGPPAETGAAKASGPIGCTSSKLLPVLDSLLAGVHVVRTLYMAGNGEPQTPRAPRGTYIVGGIGAAVLHLSSAYYGDRVTSRCAEAETRAAARVAK